MTNIINDVKIIFDYRSSADWDESIVLLNGEIGIVKLSSTDIRIKVGDGSTTFANLPYLSADADIDLSQYYTKAETYNKTEIDSKVSSVYKYKGTVPSAMLLPDTKDTGDVYNTVFSGYVPIQTEHNYVLTGISYDGGMLTVDTEITLTFENNVLDRITSTPIDGCDIAFWLDSYYFFIGKVVSASTNSYVVKIANLDTKDTIYYMNPCFEAIDYYKYLFSSGSTTSLTLQSVNYWQNVGSAIPYEFIPKGGNVACAGGSWDSLGTTVDTSNLVTKNEMNNAIASAITTTLNTEV